MLARWSWPRFRYDQLMDVGWKVMIPWGLVNLIVVAVWMEYGDRLSRLMGLSFEQGMAVIGWGALIISWLVVTWLDPTAGGNRPRLVRLPNGTASNLTPQLTENAKQPGEAEAQP
jgi:NADH-quinone oxidoreductase subunit H